MRVIGALGLGEISEAVGRRSLGHTFVNDLEGVRSYVAFALEAQAGLVRRDDVGYGVALNPCLVVACIYRLVLYRSLPQTLMPGSVSDAVRPGVGQTGIHTSSSEDERFLNSAARAGTLLLITLTPPACAFKAVVEKTNQGFVGRFLGSWFSMAFFLSSRRSNTFRFSGEISFFFLPAAGFAAAFFAGAFAVFLALVVVAFAFALGLGLVLVAAFAAVRPVVLLAVAVAAKPRTATRDL